MTDQHPITPPPELVKQWHQFSCIGDFAISQELATQAARWGADQELEECCAEVLYFEGKALAKQIRAARRPEPPSLKEQALAALEDDDIDVYLIRRALEALPDD
jgi:hypothetical protein